MEAKVNLPVPVEKYGFKHKKLKSKWMKEVRKLEICLLYDANTSTLLFHFRPAKQRMYLKKA